MKLSYYYAVVDDFKTALAFYRDELGLDEAWREGEKTASFVIPGSEIQIMVDERRDDSPIWASGPMYQVDDLDAWLAEHPSIPRLGEDIFAPGVRITPLSSPGSNAFHVFELGNYDFDSK